MCDVIIVLILSFSAHIFAQAPDTLCVWHSTGDDWDRYNGEYTKQNLTFNGSPWYQQSTTNNNCPTSSATEIYAARNTNGKLYWQVHDNMTMDRVPWYPYCQNIARYPTSCNSWIIDDAIGDAFGPPMSWSITATACPTLPCSYIQVTNSGHSDCDRIFAQHIGSDYVYTDGALYLYFNQWTFKWYCSATDGHMDCDNDADITHQIWSSSTDQWSDVVIGSHFDLSVTTGNRATLSCLDTLQPSAAPSATTNIPTMRPTFEPTQEPTYYPTMNPTQIPSTMPTITQTNSSRVIPTEAPSTSTPTVLSTSNPTHSPFACAPDLVSFASWSASYLCINVNIDNTNNTLNIQPLSNLMDCSDIFNETTNILIGENAVCTVEIHTVNRVAFTIDLSSTSTITLNDSLTVRRSAINYLCADDDTPHNLNNDIVVTSISQPMQHSVPNIVISRLFTVIGVCDDLILDARSTTNLGGRSALFEWKVSVEGSQISDKYQGSYNVIRSNALSKDKTYNIELFVTNWFGATSSVMFDVFVSNGVTPTVFISGITEYCATNLNLNGRLNMMAHVTFDDSCLNEGSSAVLDYDITWRANIINVGTMAIEEDKWLKLNDFLQDESDERREEISLNAVEVLQSGFVYEFSVNIECIGDYDCNINAVHQVTFNDAPIDCKIMSNDILLNGVDAIRDLDFAMVLDGNTLTYDPDESDSLQWRWNCVDDAQHSCDYLLDSVHNATVNMDLSQTLFAYAAHYLFTVNMNVSDAVNIDREACSDSFIVEIYTAAERSEDAFDEKTLIVTVTSISSEVTRNDKLQLLGNIINYPLTELVEEGFVAFEWKEVNELLTADDLTSYKQTSRSNAINLILREGVLISGETYSFQLSVTQYDNDNMDNVLGYGLSAHVHIYILNEPKTLSDSFQIEPECNKQYSSILGVLSSPYSLSVSADGDHTPLLYMFGYKYNDDLFYFESSTAYESVVSDLFLPIGDFNVFVDVIGTKSSVISEQISCAISLSSYSLCLDDFNTEIISPYLADHSLMSLPQKTSYILQQSMRYLQYLHDEYIPSGATDKCIEESLSSLIHLMHFYAQEACAHNVYRRRTLSRLLSHSMTLWINLFTTSDTTFDQDIFDMVQNVLVQTLDPCAYIMHNSSSIVESFYVSQYSMITKIPKIYYDAVDVTDNLSPLLIHPRDHPILLSLSSAMFTLFEHIPSHQAHVLHNLLSDSLYISQLVRVSLSIPYESSFTEFADFSLYSARVKNEDVNISVSDDIDVFLAADVTANSGSGLLDAVDVIIAAMNSSSNEVATTVNKLDDNSECDDFNKGTLAENVVSIIVNTNTSHLSSNISLTFICDEASHCDDTFECVWYNKTGDVWQDDGCHAEVDSDTNSIHCSCNHLTAFSTIHNVHSYECGDNEYIAAWLRSKLWNWISLFMAVLFLCICLFVVKEVHPFYHIHKTVRKVTFQTHRAVYAVILIGIASFLYMLIYIVAYCTKVQIENGANPSAAIKVYTLLLLLSQVVLFMFFTLIFYTWFGLAHSFLPTIDEVRQQIRYVLVAVNLFIWCIFMVYYGLTLTANFSPDDTIYRMTAYIWSVMLSIAALFVIIYSILVDQVLYRAARISQDQEFARTDWKVVRRLLIINSCLTLYFGFHAFSNIYLAADPQSNQTVAYSSLYSLVDALCLLIIFWMYRSSLHHLRDQDSFERATSNTLTTTTKRRTVLKNRLSATPSGSVPQSQRAQRRNTMTVTPTPTPMPIATEMAITHNTRYRTSTLVPPTTPHTPSHSRRYSATISVNPHAAAEQRRYSTTAFSTTTANAATDDDDDDDYDADGDDDDDDADGDDDDNTMIQIKINDDESHENGLEKMQFAAIDSTKL